MKKEFWVVIVTYEDGTVNVSQEIYKKYESAKAFIYSRSDEIKEVLVLGVVGKVNYYDTKNKIKYEIKGVELGD